MSERPPISPRSPRAALEPEQVPPPPRRSERARNPFVVVGNAIFTILIILMIGAGATVLLRQADAGNAGPAAGRQDRQHSRACRQARHRRRAAARRA